MIFKDYYKILGLETNRVTMSQIKVAYREQAKKYHPDVNISSKKNEEIFKDVNEAYRVLSNQSSKRKYDRMWNHNVGKAKKNVAYEESKRSKGSVFSDFFKMFFGADLDNEKEDVQDKKKSNKVVNIILIICSSLLALIVAGIAIVAIVYPKMSEKVEVVVPDVANLSVVEAEKLLKDAGLTVATELEEKNDGTIEEGKVISTKPQHGRSVKVDTEITLVVSMGANGLNLENYVGQNYFEVKGTLEANGIYVLVEKKEVSEKDKDSIKENIVLEQKPESGTKVVEGDTVTLYIPDIITEYPDFVSESWPLSDIQTFCEEYKITLVTEYEETDNYPEGTILKQSRAKGNKVMANTTLKVTIAKAPIEVIEPTDPIENLLPTE